MKIYFFLLFIPMQLLRTVSSCAQEKIFNAAIENGNIGNFNSIQQDRQGYIWFSAGLGGNVGSGGFHRYDGRTIISYMHDDNDSNSLANNWAECLYIDSAGIIWIGTFGSGLDRFDPVLNAFTHFHHDVNRSYSLSNDSVQCILEDAAGNFWVGTKGGLNLFDRKTGRFTHYLSKPDDPSTLSSNNVRVLYHDRGKTLWVGCGSPFPGEDASPGEGGLNRFNNNTGKFTRYVHDPGNPKSIANNKMRTIFEDSKGNFWVGTAGDGLQTLDRATGNFTHYYYDAAHPEKLSRPFYDPLLPFDHITFITEDAAGALWIGTLLRGINKYDPLTKKMTHYGSVRNTTGAVMRDSISGLTGTGVWSSFFSKDGLLWISTLGGVLYNVDIKKTTIPYYNNGSSNTFYYEQQTNTLWIGTEQGLIKKNPDTKIEKQWTHDPRNPNSISDNSIGAMRADAEGKLWLATGRGLNRFDPLTSSFTTYWPDAKDRGSQANYMYNLLIDHNKDIWLATGYGVYKMDHQTKRFTGYVYSITDSSSLSNNSAICLAEDSNNNIWIGTRRGINRLDPKTGKISRFLNSSGSVFTSVFTDADGVVWAGAYDGLFRYNKANNSFSRYLDANSKTEIIHVLHIMEDNKRNLWVSTSSSIVKINAGRDTVKVYGENYGVHSNSFLYSDNLIGANGELFIGDSKGYYAFSPGQLRDNSSVPQVNFTSFKIGDEEIKPATGGILSRPVWDTKEIKLNYKQNVFSFEFVGLDYKSARQTKYLFRLENYDDNWRPVGIERKAYLFNIPPGEYIFHVRAVNADGLWGEKAISVIITPPWWETWWFRVLSVIALIIVIYAIIKERSRKLKAENILLEEKVNERTAQLKSSLDELKSTQAQLIQSEKMASLGELTAGIAHEIQNPLNFVNNFSEVNSELIKELEGDRRKAKDERDETLEDEIIHDIKQNLEKINHHGKRADAIVKGMLQHSRISSGQKEMTDINALADEYLRLAYHGLRAKDKQFNATFHTDFDNSIGKIQVVPQDIGRVLLNLFNNAFYAVNEKAKLSANGYQPTAKVSTRKLNNAIEIKVEDNGNGIPKSIIDKIFQPFFTTKPTGQGTGLGLSLSYDIVKAHGGEIKVETKEGEGSAFIIRLPV